MRPGTRMALPMAFLLALVGLLAAIAAISAWAGDRQSSPAAEPAVDLIAYADPSGRIHVVDRDGGQDTMVSEASGFFTWPVWSPDATSLAFSGLSAARPGPTVLEMHEYDLTAGTTTRVYAGGPGMGPILDRMPHYPLWSPDSSKLSIMASEMQGLTLLLTEPGMGTPRETLMRNAPLYAGWSSDSSRLVVHAGAEQYVVNVHKDEPAKPIGGGSLSYRAPSWRPGSNQVAFVSSAAQDRQELTVLDVVAGDSLVLQPVVTSVAFSWSPDGRWLAVGETLSSNAASYKGVRLFFWDGSRSIDAIEAPIVAFFWSPDSRYIAYATPPNANPAFEWWVHDIASGTSWHIAAFVPTNEQATIFRFFDQFSQSHSVWSPQSDALVFTGILMSEGVSASYRTQTPASVMVADAMALSPVRIIATGVLAVWPPR